MNPLGAVAGLGVGIGIVMIAAAWAASRPSVLRRVAPYVGTRHRASRLLYRPPHTSIRSRLLEPISKDAARILARLGSTNTSIERRLDLIGAAGLDTFRLEQVLWAAVGLGIGLGVGLPLTITGRTEPVAAACGIAIAGVCGALLRDRHLTRAVAARQQRIAAELPTIAELLALAVSAGESPTAALERVARTTHGDLAREITRTLADVRAGAGITAALDALARRVDLIPLTRFADGVSVAIERGSPLAEVLRAQAADARDAAKRDLMEAGGKKEIAMLVPVVFLVLPLTVLFALFPGISLIEGGLG